MDRKSSLVQTSWYSTNRSSINSRNVNSMKSSVYDKFPCVASRIRVLQSMKSKYTTSEKFVSKETDDHGSKVKTPVIKKIDDPVTYFEKKQSSVELDMSAWKMDLFQTLKITKHFHCMKTSTLVFSGCNLGDKSGEAIAKGLVNNSTVRDLNLSKNCLGSSAVQALARLMLVNKTLDSLDLSSNNLSDDNIIPLIHSLGNNFFLKKLNISHNLLTDGFAAEMNLALQSKTCILEKLYLSSNLLGDTGLSSMSAGLMESNTLEFLDISWNYLNDSGMQSLGEIIKANKSLLDILICGNLITASGAFCIAESIKENSTLKTLKMGQNLITSAGALEIVTTLRTCPQCVLESLDLNGVIVDRTVSELIEDLTDLRPNLRITNFTVAVEESDSEN